MSQAELGRFIDDCTVEYVRTFPHPIERVWRAITEPAEFGTWFIKGRIDLRVGGAFHFECGDWDGVVQAIDPPRLIRFANTPEAAGYFEYELTGTEGGTRLRFLQYFPPADADRFEGVLGGWHELLDSLGEWLDGNGSGGMPGTRLPPSEFSAVAAIWARGAVASRDFDQATADRYLLDLRRSEEEHALNKLYRELINAQREAPTGELI